VLRESGSISGDGGGTGILNRRSFLYKLTDLVTALNLVFGGGGAHIGV